MGDAGAFKSAIKEYYLPRLKSNSCHHMGYDAAK
jgi:hypothetical protein